MMFSKWLYNFLKIWLCIGAICALFWLTYLFVVAVGMAAFFVIYAVIFTGAMAWVLSI